MPFKEWWEFYVRIQDSKDKLKIPDWKPLEKGIRYSTKQAALEDLELRKRSFGPTNVQIVRCECHVDN